MKLADFLNQTFSEETLNHMAELRYELLNKGFIKTFNQKYLYTKESKLAALAWYKTELIKQDEKNSSGSYGKYFEVATRIRHSILHGFPYAVDDVKSRNCKLSDMRFKIDGKTYEVELKTGHGAITNGNDRVTCLKEFDELLKGNKLFVWDYLKNGCPLCFKACDLFRLLEAYNGDIETWLVWKDGGEKRQTALSFQTFHTSKKKLEYLESLAFESYDWETIVEQGTFGE